MMNYKLAITAKYTLAVGDFLFFASLYRCCFGFVSMSFDMTGQCKSSLTRNAAVTTLNASDLI